MPFGASRQQEQFTVTTLSVVIPAFNEESGIADISQRVLATHAHLRDVGVNDLELLVVDDGSSDQTAEKLIPW